RRRAPCCRGCTSRRCRPGSAPRTGSPPCTCCSASRTTAPVPCSLSAPRMDVLQDRMSSPRGSAPSCTATPRAVNARRRRLPVVGDVGNVRGFDPLRESSEGDPPMGTAYIIDAVRTPRGKGKKDGALANLHPQELLAQALNGLKRTGVDLRDVE